MLNKCTTYCKVNTTSISILLVLDFSISVLYAMVSSKILFDILTLVNVSSLVFRQKKSPDPIITHIRKNGYPVEAHTIYTEDGYRLRLHRIPHGRATFSGYPYVKNSFGLKTLGEPILLVHGAICSGSMWIVHPNKARMSLAFQLADAGYDIWLFNARGTSPSLGHRTLTIHDAKYWDFSWHEIGYYDITKSIDYILERSSRNKLFYAGHSQGCSVFAVALSTQPSYNQKIRGAFLMTPGIFVHNVQGLVKTLIETGVGPGFQEIFKIIQIYWWPSRNPIINNIFVDVCQDKSMIYFCSWVLLQIIGPLSNDKNSDKFIIFFLKDLADNISVKQLIHLQTLVQLRSFVMYDYGRQNNYKVYGMYKPPAYDLSRITVPVTILGAKNDVLVIQEDIKKLAVTLKNVQNVVMLPGNHLEFFYEKTIMTKLKQNMLEFFDMTILQPEINSTFLSA